MFYKKGVLKRNIRHFILLLLLLFLLFDLRDKLKVFRCLLNILNKRLPLITQNYMSASGAHSSKYGSCRLFSSQYFKSINSLLYGLK